MSANTTPTVSYTKDQKLYDRNPKRYNDILNMAKSYIRHWVSMRKWQIIQPGWIDKVAHPLVSMVFSKETDDINNITEIYAQYKLCDDVLSSDKSTASAKDSAKEVAEVIAQEWKKALGDPVEDFLEQEEEKAKHKAS